MPKQNTAAEIEAFAKPLAEKMGLTLWDTELVRVGSELTLRFTVDKPEGVGIEDCESFSRAVDPLLDEHDPIEGEYSLEVTSPGVERSLTKPWHFSACRGEKAALKLYTADENGKKTYEGVIIRSDDASVTVTDGEGEHTLSYKSLSAASTVFDWND